MTTDPVPSGSTVIRSIDVNVRLRATTRRLRGASYSRCTAATGTSPLIVSAQGRIVWVSSGGMYTEPLAVDRLIIGYDSYRGSVACAHAKRAQVTLTEMMAERVDRSALVVHAMHPGWAPTPGVESSLPTFRRLMGPLLRTAEQGADARGEPSA